MSNKSNGSTKKSSVSRIPFLSKRRNTAVSSSTTTTSNNNTTSQPTTQTQTSTTQQTTSTAPVTQNTGSNPNDLLSGALSNMKLNQDKRDKDKKAKKANESNSKDENDTKAQLSPFDKVILKANGLTFVADRVVGNGSFGVVVRAVIQETNEVVAIKKVLQDKRYKNRELQIMQLIHHPCIVELKHHFYTNGEKPDEVYLNLVLEFIPDTVYRVSRHYTKMKQQMPILCVKLYAYQLLRSLAYIHSLGICHRDIKPQNLLLDPNSGILKLCDFGSAKILVKGEPNVSYICSRYYRAPELIFGATNYTTSIDVWSAGCVVAELLLGQPLFPGESGVDQLVEIIKVLGTPTKEEIQAMNSTYTEYKFPQIKGHPWNKVFRSKTPADAIDLVSKLLQYTPTTRLKPLEALTHPFFDELRQPGVTLPTGKPLPNVLFNFSEPELKDTSQALVAKLIPPHAQQTVSLTSSSGSYNNNSDNNNMNIATTPSSSLKDEKLS